MRPLLLQAAASGWAARILDDSGTGFIVIRMAAVLFLTVFAAKLAGRLAARTKKDSKINYKFLYSILVVAIYAAGILVALWQISGFSDGLQAILGASGIVALTVGLAAQESFGNIVSGMMISIFKPFEVGDRVALVKGNITGYIEDITLRHTVIRTFINSRVIVPNSVINSDMIENSNYLDGKASGFVDAVVAYDSDMELAQSIMSRVVTSHPDYDDPRPLPERGAPAKVYVRGLSLYGVQLRISMWTRNIDSNFDACSDARRSIKQEFDRHGIRFAASSVTSSPEAGDSA